MDARRRPRDEIEELRGPSSPARVSLLRPRSAGDHRRRIRRLDAPPPRAGGRSIPSYQSPDSPTQRVGGTPREGFVKVPHSSPMLSLDNALNEAELREFDQPRSFACWSPSHFRYVAEVKLDGLSMAAHYRRQPIEAGIDARRRSGRRRGHRERPHHSFAALARRKAADSATAFEVRGEVVMQTTAFERLNDEREKAGSRDSPTPGMRLRVRSGRSSPKLTAARQLDFFAYFLFREGRPLLDSQWESLDELAVDGLQGKPEPAAVQRPGRTVGVYPRTGKPSGMNCPTRSTA